MSLPDREQRIKRELDYLGDKYASNIPSFARKFYVEILIEKFSRQEDEYLTKQKEEQERKAREYGSILLNIQRAGFRTGEQRGPELSVGTTTLETAPQAFVELLLEGAYGKYKVFSLPGMTGQGRAEACAFLQSVVAQKTEEVASKWFKKDSIEINIPVFLRDNLWKVICAFPWEEPRNTGFIYLARCSDVYRPKAESPLDLQSLITAKGY